MFLKNQSGGVRPGRKNMRRLDRLPQLRISDFLRAAGVHSPKALGGQVAPWKHYYGYGRQALGDALRVCGCRSGDAVLYPDFICDVTLEPARRLGIRVVYYPVRDDLAPDWRALEALASRFQAKAVMSMNYFGFPQPMDHWRRFSQQRGLCWINDNAHGYGNRVDGEFLDDFGDVSFSSPRKVLPLLNGAVLQLNRPKRDPVDAPRPPDTPGAHLPNEEELRRVLRSIERIMKPLHRPPANAPYSCLPPPEETAARFRAMDRLSRRLLSRFDLQLDQFTHQRRHIYAVWHDGCVRRGLKPVFPHLTPGVSPMVFPCYAADFDERQRWLRWAAERNVDAYPWPSLPAACRQPGSVAVDRWRRLLCFPIHPFMQPSEIESRFLQVA